MRKVDGKMIENLQLQRDAAIDDYNAVLKALNTASVALDDWVVSYAPDMCGEEVIEETSKRMGSIGTLAYIADVQKIIREAIGDKKMDEELSDKEYLADLAERLRHIPVMYGTDGYDIDRLESMSNEM